MPCLPHPISHLLSWTEMLLQVTLNRILLPHPAQPEIWDLGWSWCSHSCQVSHISQTGPKHTAFSAPDSHLHFSSTAPTGQEAKVPSGLGPALIKQTAGTSSSTTIMQGPRGYLPPWTSRPSSLLLLFRPALGGPRWEIVP